jgi:CRP/FNR family transcriptional regulator
MITWEQFHRLETVLPVLQQAELALQREILANGYYAKIPAHMDIFVEGDQADALALLLSGVVRVYKIGESGREITLYRFGTGESCILTANAILSEQTFPALATVEQDAEAIMIPADSLRFWVRRFDIWYGFLLDLLSQRLAAMLAVVDEVTFRRMDARLADLLLHRSDQQNPILATHQELAADLGSSREVISRLLADLAALKAIELSRGAITVINKDLLGDRALL